MRVEVTDTTTGEKVMQTQTTYLYEQSPVKCTFGLLNPAFPKDQKNFCDAVVDQDIVNEVIKEREEETKEVIVVDQLDAILVSKN